MKDDAIVLRECSAIVADMPSELRQDDEILDAVLNSLTQGQSAMKVRQDALEIAQMKLEAKVDKGFELVASEFQKVRHEAEKDRIHATYAQKEAEQARAIAEQALEKTQDLAVGVARADAKADGAKDLAKNARWANFDPLTGMLICVALFILGFIGFSRIEVKQEKPAATRDTPVCGIDVDYDVRPLGSSRKGGI
jgi:hypothetical protein